MSKHVCSFLERLVLAYVLVHSNKNSNMINKHAQEMFMAPTATSTTSKTLAIPKESSRKLFQFLLVGTQLVQHIA